MSGIFVYTGIVGFLAGVALRSVADVPVVVFVVIGCAGVVVGVVGVFIQNKACTVCFAAAIFLLLSCLGLIRTNMSMWEHSGFLDEKIGHAVLEGMVVSEPSFSEKSQKITVEIVEGDEEARVSVIASLFPEFQYGDTLRITGVLKKPETFTTDTGREFDYPAYLAREHVFHQMLFPKIEIMSHGGGNILFRMLFAVRRTFIETLKKFLPEPDAGLLAGISIGAQDGMDEKTTEMFRRIGLSHIVVLSGYNITVVSDSVMRTLSFLPRTLMLSGGGVIVVLFVVMTGASATAVRAGAMAVLALCARFLGARYDITRALFVVAFVMVAWNPRVLLYDPSFQLSFLATFGLITLSPVFEKWFKNITNMFSLRQTLAATLATQVFVVPLLVYLSGQMSIISLIANVLVLPMIPLSMFFGSVLGIVGSFSHVLGIAMSFPTVFVSRYILVISNWLSRVPFAAIETPALGAPVLCVIYAVLFLCVMRGRARTTRLPSSSS